MHLALSVRGYTLSSQHCVVHLQVSALKLQPRTSAPDFAQLGLLATRDDERGMYPVLNRGLCADNRANVLASSH